MDFFNSCIDPDFLSFLASMFAPMFVAGILLGVTAWVVSFLINVTFKFFKM